MNGVGYLILRLVDLMKNNEIVFEKQKNRIATITFNRPDHLNAISFDGWKQLTQISEELKKDNFHICYYISRHLIFQIYSLLSPNNSLTDSPV